MYQIDALDRLEPFTLQKVTCPEESWQENQQRHLRLLIHLTQLLANARIGHSFCGSASVFLGLMGKYQGFIHDIDFMIYKGDVDKVRDLFERNGFDFWQENFIHRRVRNLTGGKGRHHNYAAASANHCHKTSFPIWIGIFAYDGGAGEVTFSEYLAVSERKVRLMLTRLLSQGYHLKEYLQRLLEREKIDKEGVLELLRTFKTSGLGFWSEINHPEVNQRDLEYRDAYRALEQRYHQDGLDRKYPEHYFEFQLKTKYPISAERYLFSQQVTLPNQRVVYIVPLEISYLILSQFYPHYLGARKKYLDLASAIKVSGILNPERLEFFREVFDNREEQYELIDEFDFEIGSNRTLNPAALSKSPNKGEPNYLALFLEGVHYSVDHQGTT